MPKNRGGVTVREEDDLGDEVVVGHHHGDGSEERDQVVGQVGPVGVGRVHRDENSYLRVKRYFLVLEKELDAPFK